MSKLTLHLQYEPDYLPNFVNRCQGKLRWIKGVNCYPNLSGVSTIGRVYVDDNLSNRLVMRGADGVDQWIYICRGEYEKARHVYAWQGPNEFIIDSYEKSARWNEFHVAFIVRMSALGLRCMVGNINTGWPRLRKYNDAPPYPPAIRPTIEALVQHDGILSLHEYGPGDMRTGQGAHCLRYRNTVAELREAGVPIPRIFIGECGIDVPDPNFPLDHHHKGWTEWTDRAGYLEQLKWYAGELAQDEKVEGAAVFTGCNWDWVTFNVDRELAMGIADIVAWEPEVVPVVPDTVILKPEPLPWVDISGNLPQHPDSENRYEHRNPSQVARTVIHHSVTEPADESPAGIVQHIKNIARQHIRIAGWPAVAYHVIIGPLGDAYLVNPLDVSAYHVGKYSKRNFGNERSYGVCLLGKLHKHDPTEAQLATARRVGETLGKLVVPHKALARTACPGRWARWGEEITG